MVIPMIPLTLLARLSSLHLDEEFLLDDPRVTFQKKALSSSLTHYYFNT